MHSPVCWPRSALDSLIEMQQVLSHTYVIVWPLFPSLINRIHSAECIEYGEAVFSKEYVNSVGAEEPKLQRLDKCGHKAIELVVNGEAAKSREFPHMALIGYGVAPEVRYLCGGSLVSDRFVLTAGHCINSAER